MNIQSLNWLCMFCESGNHYSVIFKLMTRWMVKVHCIRKLCMYMLFRYCYISMYTGSYLLKFLIIIVGMLCMNTLIGAVFQKFITFYFNKILFILVHSKTEKYPFSSDLVQNSWEWIETKITKWQKWFSNCLPKSNKKRKQKTKWKRKLKSEYKSSFFARKNLNKI